MNELESLKREVELLKQLVDTQKTLINQLQIQPKYIPTYIPYWQIYPQHYQSIQPYIVYGAGGASSSGSITINESTNNVLTMGSR